MTPANRRPPAFEHYESIYWVFTQLCNDTCAHCYNDSGPRGERISTEDCLAIVENLPAQLDRLILSGGEPLTERPKLYAILDALRAKYAGRTQIMLQTNGDLLTGEILDEIIARGSPASTSPASTVSTKTPERAAPKSRRFSGRAA